MPLQFRHLKRLAPQFSLRFLLVAAALLSVWLGSHVKRTRDQEIAVESLRQAGARVTYSFQLPPKGLTLAQELNWSPPLAPTDSPWVHDLVGEQFFRKVHSVSLWEGEIADMPSDLLSNLAKTPDIRWLSLTDARITNADLRHLERLHYLEELSLDCPSVTDDGLRYISGLINLKHLSLRGDGFTDAGLKHIRGLTNLEHLVLESNEIAGAGVPYLWNLKKLRSLDYEKTWIQDDALKELLSRLPLLQGASLDWLKDDD